MSRSSLKTYFRSTRTATYGYLSALPLLFAYELLVVLYGPVSGTGVRLGADIWLRRILWDLGVRSHLGLGLVVLAVGAAVFWWDRNRRVSYRANYFLGLVAESCVYAVVLALAVSQVVGFIFAYAGPALGGDQLVQIGMSLGAGLYEELVFRVFLVGVIYWMADRFLVRRSRRAYQLAAVVAALIFSAVHYIGAYGDIFTLASFTFRFLFGLALNVVYIMRGFGVAAWTHSAYNLMLTLTV